MTATQYTHNVPASRESHDAQEREGILERRQRGILNLLLESGPMGRTAAEIEKATGENHGKVSGALSAMHREGQIAALKLDRRNGYGVYVLPGHVHNRLVRPYQPNAKAGAREVAVPVEVPPRAHLTSAEREIVAKVRALVNGGGDNIVRMYPSTARSLLNMIDRLNA